MDAITERLMLIVVVEDFCVDSGDGCKDLVVESV